ncbi:MAG TPA: DUF58 domain-containing protein [Solirubrobacteraceae bacterium]|nr:DUF58 domain-containing protein [Solirubrobacteraceae bacterium]
MKRAVAVGVAGLALILIALTFEAAPLFVPGIALIVLGLAAPAWVNLAARGAAIERRLDSDRVVEEEPIEATIEVSRGNWGLPGAAVLDPLAGKPVLIHAPMSLISGGRTASVRIVARFPRRGIRRIDPPSLVVADALELARAVVVSTSPAQELLVLPRTERVRWAPGAGEKWRRAAGNASVEPLGATEVDGLRPYRDGTPASRIHWPALARGMGLLERRLRADTDSRPLVVVDARQPGPPSSPSPPEHLDAAVRAAASLVLELGGRVGCGLLLPGEHRPLEVEPDLTAWPVAHARLALIEGGPDTRAPGLAPGARSAQVVYVAATAQTRLPAGLAGAGVRAAVLVIPKPLVTQPLHDATFEVAGCIGFVVGAGRRQRERVAA